MLRCNGFGGILVSDKAICGLYFQVQEMPTSSLAEKNTALGHQGYSIHNWGYMWFKCSILQLHFLLGGFNPSEKY